MSWTSCMQGKIEDQYGSQAAECISAGSEGNLEGIVGCIINIIGDADPEIVLAELGIWSTECAL